MALDRLNFIDTIRGYIPARIIQTAVKLDLFDQIPLGGITSKNLSKKLDIKPQPAELFCNALASLDLLTKKKSLFSLSSFSEEHLVSTSKNYLGYLVKQSYDSMESFTKLDEVLKTGKSVKNLSSVFKNRDSSKNFTLFMHTVSSFLAPHVSKLLDFSSYRKILDIGGGPGTYSIQFCEDNPRLSATVLDLPSVLSWTKKIVKQYQMMDRFSFLPADYTKDPIPTGYDIAFLSNIIHMESPEVNADLIRKIYSSLQPRGMIVLQDYVLDDDLASPQDGTLFAISMLLHTDKGRCYSFSEIKNWLREAGFKKVTEIEPKEPRRSSLVYAQKI